MKKTKSYKFGEEERKLREKVIKELRKKAPKKMLELGENGFEDEARNDIRGVDKDGLSESYPLGSLGLLDAICLLGILEEIN
jgi:hypothetical protein